MKRACSKFHYPTEWLIANCMLSQKNNKYNNMKSKIHLVILICAISFSSFAQIGIGTTSPDASAVLDMTSTTQGVLIPRMTTIQRGAITAPAIGLQVYDTDTSSIWSYNGASWVNGTGGPGKFVEGAASDIAYYDGRVGIGLDNFSTVHKLFVQGTKSTDGINTASRTVANYTGSGTSTATYGAAHNAENNSTGTISFAAGSFNTIDNLAGDISTAYGTRSEINNSTGNIIFGSGSSINITNNGTMDNAVGLFLSYLGTGVTTNSYGIFINSNFDEGTVANYAIYSQPNIDSYLQGNLGVGTDAPQQKVHISGAMRLEPQATAPTGTLGDLYVGTDGNLYFHNGVDWQEVALVP